MSDWLEEATDVASQVARVVHRKYSVYFDVADVRQELLAWVWRRESKVKYCRRVKAQKLGYEIRDEQYYDPITLSELLPFVWGEVVDTKRHDGEKVSGAGNPAEGGNYVIQLFDVRRALAKLDEMDRDVLELKYEQNLTFAEIAEVLEMSDTTAHRKVEGATRRLHNQLGGANPFGKGEE